MRNVEAMTESPDREQILVCSSISAAWIWPLSVSWQRVSMCQFTGADSRGNPLLGAGAAGLHSSLPGCLPGELEGGRTLGVACGCRLHSWAAASSLDHRALWQWSQFSLRFISEFSKSLFVLQWRILSTAAAFSSLTPCQGSRENLEVLIQGFSCFCVFKLKALPRLLWIRNPWLSPFQCEHNIHLCLGEKLLGLLL